MRLYRASLGALVICLSQTVACSHGPRLNVCASNTAEGAFDCSMPATTFHHPKPTTLPYEASAGYVVYPTASAQSVYDYCASRFQTGIQAPQFDSCESHPDKGGLSCVRMDCLIESGNRMACSEGPSYFVAYSGTENFIGFSAVDNQTLMDYCGITVKASPQ